MQETMNYKEALKYSMNLCGKQERCKSEVRFKLQKYGLNDTDIERVLTTLEDEGFIDESRFVAMFASDKLRFNKWGRIKIRYMLNQKQIPGEIIDEILGDMDEVEYEYILKQEITKKRKSIRSGSTWEIRNKLFGFARQRGFEPDIIKIALDAELE